MSMRLASMPFSWTRYSRVCSARSAASLFLSCSCVLALPISARRSSLWRCMFRAISSRQALASLLTRAGRRRSRAKLMEQSLLVASGMTAAGVVMMTGTVAVAIMPMSSSTLAVTMAVPAARPAVVKMAVAPLPVMTPADELKL